MHDEKPRTAYIDRLGLCFKVVSVSEHLSMPRSKAVYRLDTECLEQNILVMVCVMSVPGTRPYGLILQDFRDAPKIITQVSHPPLRV